MKTITEFHVATLKTAHKTRQELLTAGKTAEELPAALGEALKLEGDKLANLIAALGFVEADTKSKSLDLKRVIVQTLTEKETAGVKTSLPSLKREDFYFTIEYFPPLPGQEKKQPRGRDGNGDERGSRGGRDGKRGGRDGKGKGGPRGDRDGGRGGDRPRGPGRDNRDAGAPRPEGAPGETRRPPRAPRDPNAPQAARPPREPNTQRTPRPPRAPAPERAPIIPPDASLLNDGKSPFKIVMRSAAELAEAASKMPKPTPAPAASEKPAAEASQQPQAE